MRLIAERRPEVVEVARSLGICLASDEVSLYRAHVAEHLEAVDLFVQSRIEEPRPPMVSPRREPGYRPHR